MTTIIIIIEATAITAAPLGILVAGIRQWLKSRATIPRLAASIARFTGQSWSVKQASNR